MDNLILKVDLNILLKKIKNQFLAAISGIIFLVVVGIIYVTTINIPNDNKYIAIAAFIVIAILSTFIVFKLNDGAQQLRKINEENKKNTKDVSHKLWRLIVGFGEGCLDSDVPDNKRMFLDNALSQVIESEVDSLQSEELLFKNILLEIKSASDSEINQKKVFSEVLKKQSGTQVD